MAGGGGAGGAAGDQPDGAGGTPTPERAATPEFSIPGGSYPSPQRVEMTCATPTAAIHFTQDGSTPSASSPVYQSSVQLAAGTTTTLRAFAVAAGYLDSAIKERTYAIEEALPGHVSNPEFSAPAITCADKLVYVTIRSATPGTAIHYTLDGTVPTANSPLYAEPVELTTSTTIKALGTRAGYVDSTVSAATFEFPDKAPPPHITPPPGGFMAPLAVEMSSTVPDAQIFYTLNGCEPRIGVARYAAPVLIYETTLVRAIAVAPGTCPSPMAEAPYGFAGPDGQAAPPLFSPPPGSYSGALAVTIYSSNPNAEIRYTTDGTDPTAASEAYSIPVPISKSLVMKAIASIPGFSPSPISQALYTVCPCAAPPTISPNGGHYYYPPVDVTLNSPEPNGQILYTLDGSLPTSTTGLVYTGPFAITDIANLVAVTRAPGLADSPPVAAGFGFCQCCPQADSVSITPATESSDNDINVTLGTQTTGAAICYTTDGSTPACTIGAGVCQKGQPYAGVPVVVDATGTVLRAVACASDLDPSAGNLAWYTLKVGPVQLLPAAGPVPSGTAVDMTSSTQNAIIHYRTDGLDPTCTSGEVLSDPLPITADTVVRAIACKSGYESSEIAMAEYVVSN